MALAPTERVKLMILRTAGITVLVMLLSAPHAFAQTGNRLAVGGAIIGLIAGSEGAEGSYSISPEWRIGHERQGWGGQFALNWFETAVREPIGGQTMGIGRMNVRPIMGGYGYTLVRGRTSITADLMGGYAFSSFEIDPAADAAYRSHFSHGTVTTDAGNTFVVMPEVHVWYDVSRRIGLKLTTGYMVARPSVTFTSALGEDIRHINADRIMVNVGLVYRIF